MTQTNQIRQHLESGKHITSLEALNLFGCFRLASRISELKKAGYNIATRLVHNGGKHYAEYWLVTE